MPTPFVWTAASAVVATFLWAAAAKLIGFPSWRRALAGYRIPRSVERVVAVGVPLVELTAAGLLALTSTKVGAALALSLLGLFCAAILRGRATTGDRLPCGCFGRAEALDYRAMLVRNALLAAACAVVLTGEESGGLVTGVEAPGTEEILPLVLVGAGLVMASWTVRQAMGSMRRREHS